MFAPLTTVTPTPVPTATPSPDPTVTTTATATAAPDPQLTRIGDSLDVLNGATELLVVAVAIVLFFVIVGVVMAVRR